MANYTIKVIDNPEYCDVGACGVHFAHGKAVTEDERAASWFREHEGYEVIEEVSKKNISDMNAKELVKYAKDNNIELGDARKKEEILSIIEGKGEESQ